MQLRLIWRQNRNGVACLKRFYIHSQKILSLLLSLAVLLLVLLIFWAAQQVNLTRPDTLLVRKIDIAISTPPPPPPVVPTKTVDSPITVQVDGGGAAIAMSDMSSDVAIIVKDMDMPQLNTEAPQWQSLEINFDAFDLDQLDGLPKLLTPLHAKFPKSLSRLKLDRVLVKLDVIIDEAGDVSLVGVLKNDHPELNVEIERIIRSSRFSVPTKSGESVRARFVWPVEFKT